MQTIAHSTPARQCVQSDLIEQVYACLPARARKLALMFRETCGAILDAEDLQQAGIEYAIRRLDRATQAVNPMGFLLHAAQFAMLNYCKEQRGPVRVPRSSQRRGHTVPQVVSLDAPLVGREDLTLLDLIPAGG